MWILEPKLVWAGGILISFTSFKQMGKLRPREGRGPAQGHSQSQEVESGLVPPGTLVLTTIITGSYFCFTGAGREAGPFSAPQWLLGDPYPHLKSEPAG